MKTFKKVQRSINKKSGFTLIELSISLSFISILLIVICTVTMYIIAIYEKGLAMKTINTVGSAVVEDISNSITNSSVSVDNANSVIKIIGSGSSVQAFCTDAHTYAWVDLKIGGASQVASKDFRLVRFGHDNAVCNNDSNGSGNASQIESAITKARSNGTLEELVMNKGQALAVYGFKITKSETKLDESNNISYNNMRRFYAVSFYITTETGLDLTANNCTVSDKDSMLTVSSDFNYCAINQFNFAARPAGGDIL